jgi:hypothetical protein
MVARDGIEPPTRGFSEQDTADPNAKISSLNKALQLIGQSGPLLNPPRAGLRKPKFSDVFFQ